MKKFQYFLVTLLIILGFNSLCYAQRYYFRHYLTDDGLSHHTVLSILQDKKGFIWLGTKDGLNRFDGFNFRKFTNPHHQFGSVGDDQVHSLCADSAGSLWLATGRGLYQFDPQTETFNERILKPSERIGAVVATGKMIYFLASDTVWSYNQETKKLLNLNIQATCLTLDKTNQLLMGNSNGEVLQCNFSSGQILCFQVINKKLSASLKMITAVFPSGQELMVGTSKLGLLCYNRLTRRSKTLFQRNTDGTAINVRSVLAGAPGELWVATESGVFIYHASTQTTTILQKNQSDPYAINDNAIYSLCRDSDGGMWIGTYFGGVNYYTAKNSRFRKYYHVDGGNSIKGNAISAIGEDELHRIWVGTEDAGVSCLDLSTGSIKNFRPDNSPQSLGHSNVHSLLIAGRQLFVGLYDHGLEVMNLNTGLIKERFRELGAVYGTRSNFVLCLLKSKQGKIYLGTIGANAGLYEFNQSTRKISAVKGFDYQDGVFAVIEDHQGRIWVGSANNGAFCYDPHTGKTIHLRFGNSSPDEAVIAEPTVHCIYEDAQDNIWFGTEGGGVIKLDRNGITQSRYTTDSGLSSNYIYRIVEDGKHLLWMSSVKGLIRLNPSNGKITTYTKENGLITDQFNYSAAYSAANGIIYFGSIKGFVAFDPENFNQLSNPPRLYLTTLEINNQAFSSDKEDTLSKNSITYKDHLNLSHDQNNINLEFAALDYSAAKAIKYRYRMLGLNESWIYLNRNRKVYFTGLAPGNYVFEFAAESNTGEWKTGEKKLFIRIKPPVYLTVTAYLIYSCIVILVLYFLIVTYKKYISNQHNRKLEQYEYQKTQELNQSKIEFFTNIAHELRTPLTLIKLPLDQLITLKGFDGKVKENLTMINKNTNRLIELTNQLLDFRKSDRGNLNLVFVKTNVNTLLEDIYDDFQLIATQKKLNYKLELPRHLTLHAYLDIEAFKKIMVNLISNAFKYAEQLISVRIVPINSEDDSFSLEVKNDGTLIPAKYHKKVFEPFFRIDENDKNSGTGIGLSLAKSLALMHNGTITLTTNAHVNVFTVTFPLHQQTEINYVADHRENDDSLADSIDYKLSAKGLPAILLVEDHSDILKYIAQELEEEYFILKANDGVEALALLEKHQVNLVVSDIMMPGMDGLDLCRSIKTDINYSHIPVILLTAKSSVDSRIEGLGTGADVYIDKPFSMSHLHIQIKSLLKNRKLVKEHFARSPISEIKGVAYSKTDVTFLKQLTDEVSSRLSDSALDVEMLSKAMNMSRPTLYRKIKALTNMTPSALIALYRLKYAAELLAAKQYKINEIAFMIGYNSPANFTRDFQKQFGITPTAYIKGFE
ncbi:hybrid sensor histidine kinase/response regulator transcription factor [Pedobacter cryoconitis]|uniref:histidine kinase n=1 Tax=Pedobacter cryoconitis TaxID=188932 RepID=A0A327STC0_9SPHI|nr:two-component regulator propeller domain-containing protein [Pedobacter cryoconitis]RAJ32159.1 signal transduction histidine kinase [Pedobacter cryoconitis]